MFVKGGGGGGSGAGGDGGGRAGATRGSDDGEMGEDAEGREIGGAKLRVIRLKTRPS